MPLNEGISLLVLRVLGCCESCRQDEPVPKSSITKPVRPSGEESVENMSSMSISNFQVRL